MAVDSDLDNNTSTKTGHCQQGVLCAHSREHTTKDKTAKLITCSQTPTQSPCLAGPYCLSLPLDFLRQTLSSCWPAHVTSAVLDQHETLLDGAQRQGSISHQHSRHKSAALEWRSLVNCVSLCVCVCAKQLLNIFPRPNTDLD